MSELAGILPTVLVGAAILWVCLVLPYKLAKERGRNALYWVAIGLLLNPLIIILMLLLIGHAEPKPSKTKRF